MAGERSTVPVRPTTAVKPDEPKPIVQATSSRWLLVTDCATHRSLDAPAQVFFLLHKHPPNISYQTSPVSIPAVPLIMGGFDVQPEYHYLGRWIKALDGIQLPAAENSPSSDDGVPPRSLQRESDENDAFFDETCSPDACTL